MSTEQNFLQATHALQGAVAETTKSVIVEIDRETLKSLKTSGYKLCFAKRVQEATYNVVWQSYDQYLSHNEFRWTPQYQLFGANNFDDGVTVQVATEMRTVGLGQHCVLDESGFLGVATPGGPERSITMENQYGNIHPGLGQLARGVDGKLGSAPFYVSVNPVIKGKTSLTPMETILVWFEQGIESGTMFGDPRLSSEEIDLANSNQETRIFSINGGWSKP